MKKVRLGTTDVEITPLGFGTWAIGGSNWSHGWGEQDDEDSIRAIQRAVGLGINWIDTAAVYGLGHSEEVIAQALSGIPASERPYVFTKCSLAWGEDRNVYHCLDPKVLRRELEGSLRRLRVDVIDLYQIHWPVLDDGAVNREEVVAAWSALAAFQREGKVRHIGVSNFDVSLLELIAPIAPIASLQPPYSVLRRGAAKEILPWCRAHGVAVITYAPMQHGLLMGTLTREDVARLPANDWRRESAAFKEPALTANLELVERLRAVGARHGRSPGEVAIAWVLHNPAVTGVIVGARSGAEADGWIEAGTFRLSADEVVEIDRGLPPSM